MTEDTITLKREYFSDVIDALNSLHEAFSIKDEEEVRTRRLKACKLLEAGRKLLDARSNKEKEKDRMFSLAVEKWNSDKDRILAWIKIEEETSHDKDFYFYWGQLVWQEIKMWILMSLHGMDEHASDEIFVKSITAEDFEGTCLRRGFDDFMKEYLCEMLDFLEIKIVDKDTDRNPRTSEDGESCKVEA